MKRAARISLFMILVGPLLFVSQSATPIDRYLESMSGQYAECTAYYRIVHHALNASDEKEAANAYRKLEDAAMFYSLLLANEGRKSGVAVEVTNARIEIALKRMKVEADNRNENISILINKYHSGCQGAMDNPSSEVTTILRSRAGEGEEQKKTE